MNITVPLGDRRAGLVPAGLFFPELFSRARFTLAAPMNDSNAAQNALRCRFGRIN
jgi:hypothetical protein